MGYIYRVVENVVDSRCNVRIESNRKVTNRLSLGVLDMDGEEEERCVASANVVTCAFSLIKFLTSVPF